MPSNNYFKIGVFVLTGFVLFVAGLLVFGLRDRLTSSSVRCLTFFNRSVQGLSLDAAVKFRGFTIGRVTALSLAAADDLSGQPMVRVDFEINPTALAAQVPDRKNVPVFLRDEIAKGLKVYLTLQGVTGICFLDLNYGEEPQMPRPWGRETSDLMTREDDLVYIPNGPSQIFEIGESISRLVRTLNDIDLVGISREVKIAVGTIEQAVRTIEQSVGALNTGQLSRELGGTMEEIRELSATFRLFAGHLEALVNPSEGGGLGQALEASASQLRQSLRRLDQLLGSSRGGLPETLDNLRALTENLREMTELLKNQPSQAIFGRPPRAVEPEKGKRPGNVTTFNLP